MSSARNTGFDPYAYVAALPAAAIGEIHLAGFAENNTADGPVLIDNHGSCVAAPVWSLYAAAIDRIGPRPTLIEWDSALPPLTTLLGEAMWADLLANSVAFGVPSCKPAARDEMTVAACDRLMPPPAALQAFVAEAHHV